MKIRVELAAQDVGTVAIVSTRKWFVGWEHRKFVCVRVDHMFGAHWFDENGIEADVSLSYEISLTAQAEVNKRLVRAALDMTQ